MPVQDFPHDIQAAAEADLSPTTPSGWGLVGISPRMREVITQVEMAGATRAGVLVAGEPGSGRALVARAIHRCGVTANEPFVPALCDQIRPAEADDLLFGARAGGVRRPPHSPNIEAVSPASLLHRAMGGTLYLRHPEELPDRVQARLARALRDDEVVVAGETEAMPLQVRVIAAFEPNPRHHLAEGRLRQDFFRRVSAFAIEVPPLRERREDIPLLAAHFVARACRAAGLPARRLTPGAATLLAALPWPGNNRDLQTVLAAAVRTAIDPEIDLDVLLTHIRLDGTTHPGLRATGAPATLREARLEFEREYIKSVLAQQHGRIPDAARVLGIQRTNLYRKLRALRLPHAQSGAD